MSIFINTINQVFRNDVPDFWYSELIDPSFYKFSYPILIYGETGTCRSVLAHAIHKNDPKQNINSFYSINCNEIDDDSINDIFFKDIRSGTVFLTKSQSCQTDPKFG